MLPGAGQPNVVVWLRTVWHLWNKDPGRITALHVRSGTFAATLGIRQGQERKLPRH